VKFVVVGLAVAMVAANALARTNDAAGLVLEMVRGSDVRHGRSATVTVRESAIAVYLRHDLITFVVLGPDGDETTCAPIDSQRHPGRIGFTTVGPHRFIVLTTRLVEVCPRWTFSGRGDYLVGAYYDPQVSGRSVGVHAFTGRLEADRPVVVHVEHDARVVQNHVVSGPAFQPLRTSAPPPPPAQVLPPPRATPPHRR